jgi:hypothetical protein
MRSSLAALRTWSISLWNTYTSCLIWFDLTCVAELYANQFMGAFQSLRQLTPSIRGVMWIIYYNSPFHYLNVPASLLKISLELALSLCIWGLNWNQDDPPRLIVPPCAGDWPAYYSVAVGNLTTSFEHSLQEHGGNLYLEVITRSTDISE